VTERFITYTANHKMVKPFLDGTGYSQLRLFPGLSPSAAPRNSQIPRARRFYTVIHLRGQGNTG